jgi:hypothetical protein
MTGSEQSQLNLSDCGCCEGIAVETPLEINNRPGLSAIAYRVGTQTRFKASMIARLSQAGLAELRKLRTRDDDDFTIALLDAWASVCDVLTFYQERIANESFLLTATERASIINLARLIGYELRPGVAASTFLAFTLETGVGSPEAVTIDKAAKVQSLPGPGEKPQTFETIEAVEARGEWNAMKPRQTRLILPVEGTTETYLTGIATNLKSGDWLLFVGAERTTNNASEHWDARRVTSVEPDADNQRTLVRWKKGLRKLGTAESQVNAYALRLRASIFGHNAPAWNTLPVALRVGEKNPEDGTIIPGAYEGRKDSWANKKFDAIGAGKTGTINLDAVYSQIVEKSWIVLSASTGSELYRVESVSEESKADYNITAKTTELEISGESLELFSPRNASVYAQSVDLPLGETPILAPISGAEIVLDRIITPLAAGRTVVVTGKRIRVLLEQPEKADTETGKLANGALELISTLDPETKKAVAPGDELVLMSRPRTLSKQGLKRYQLRDESGFVGYLDINPNRITLIAAADKDEFVSETAAIKASTAADDLHSKLTLTASLANLYDRTTVTVSANIALATHGETVAAEVLGSGNAGQPYQRFVLKDSPLTYTSADTPSGGETTLEVRVNDLKWKEVPTLFGHGPRERIYITHTDDDRKTTVQFGDGLTGARLPIGQENVKATYRKGIGLGGLVKANQLSLLMTRPLGVKGVANPIAATGAQDPQSLADARTNSPFTVLTLDRIVSLSDYEDFARSFSGIAKALAEWSWNLHARGVFLTVAGIDGAEVDKKLHDTLVSAMMKYADAYVPITVKSYRPVTFKVVAALKIDPDYIVEKVLAAVEAALRAGFSFSAREFGQAVTLSEVMSAIQNVAGVVAVDVNKLYRTDHQEAWNEILVAEMPRAGDDSSVPAAELLTLDPAALELEVMS